MSLAVELSVNSEVMTGFCISERICCSMMTSNSRLASWIFCCCVKCLLPANCSTGTFELSIGDWTGGMFISMDHQVRLQGSRLFHRQKNGHHIAGRHTE